MSFVIKIIFVWFGFFVLAFLNGAIRELGIKKIISEPWAHHLSALIAILLFAFYLKIVWLRTGITSMEKAGFVGRPFSDYFLSIYEMSQRIC